MDSSKHTFVEREPIDPLAGSSFLHSMDQDSYYVQRAFAHHLDPNQELARFSTRKLGETKPDTFVAGTQPSDLSDAELIEFIDGMRAHAYSDGPDRLFRQHPITESGAPDR